MTLAGDFGHSKDQLLREQHQRQRQSCVMGRETNIACLVGTIVVTIATTVIMGVTVLTDDWENIYYDRDVVDDLVQQAGGDMEIQSLFEGRVLLIVNKSESLSDSQSPSKADFAGSNSSNASSWSVSQGTAELLIRMHAGLWLFCMDLTDVEFSRLQQDYAEANHMPAEKCLKQMQEQDKYLNRHPGVNSRQIRMQNLSISCSLVCLIILVSCLLVFWIGLIERQVPPVMVVSVLYLLAGVFATFSLTIARYRRQPNGHELNNGETESEGMPIQCGPLLDTLINPLYTPARRVDQSWSMYVGWVGVAFCFFSALIVYILSRLMRNPPFPGR